jgi:hypothetical protein
MLKPLVCECYRIIKYPVNLHVRVYVVARVFVYECVHRTLFSVYLLPVDIFVAKFHNQLRRLTVRRGCTVRTFIVFSLISQAFVNIMTLNLDLI